MREMKDSGLEWLGNVSSDVKLVPLKYLLKKERMPIKVGPFGSQLLGTDFLKEESDFWVYNQRIVLDENYEAGDAYISSEKYETMIGFHVYEDDILITTRGTIGKISRIPHIHKPGILHPCIIRFRIDDSLYDYRLLKLIFNQSDFVTEQILYKSNATTIEVIYRDTLKNIILPVWDMQTQRKIADFLDTKCSEIDALTADIQTQIDTLEQYKRSIITEAVTRGLNPDVEMKDGGNQYWGSIPTNWHLSDIKYLFEIVKRIAGKEGYDILSVTQKGIKIKDISNNEGQVAESYANYQFVYPGDFVMKCSTCQKAKKWLDEHNIKYTERHIVEVNPTYDELKEWYGKSGLTLKKFFNTSGLLYKEMQLKDKLPTMSEEEQIQLLATNGMLVKRPLVVNGDTVLVGFKEAEWAEKLN